MSTPTYVNHPITNQLLIQRDYKSEKPKDFREKITAFFEKVLKGAEALKSNPDGLYKIGNLIKIIRDGYNAVSKNIEYTKVDAFADKFFDALKPLSVFSFFSDIAYHVIELKGDIKHKKVFNIGFMFTATLNDAADTIKLGIDLFVQKTSATLGMISSCLGHASTALTGVAFLFKGGDSFQKLIRALKEIPKENAQVRNAAIRQAAFDLAWSFFQVGIAAVTITSLFVVSLANFWIGVPLLAFGAVALGLGSTSIIHKAMCTSELKDAEKNSNSDLEPAWPQDKAKENWVSRQSLREAQEEARLNEDPSNEEPKLEDFSGLPLPEVDQSGSENLS